MRNHRASVFVGAVALLLSMTGAAVARSPQPSAGGPAASGSLRVSPASLDPSWSPDRRPNPTLAAKLRRGALPIDADGYDALKDRLAAEAPAAGDAAAGAAGPTPRIASVTPSFPGPNDVNSTPSDSTGAIGTTRYITTVNTKVRIADRSGSTIATDTLTNFFQESADNFDPQIMWDPGTSRFFYAGDAVVSSGDNRLAIGYSKSASPNNATTDWCHYEINSYGALFPDYPKLGDAKNFFLLGVNVFNGNTYVRSDAIWVAKPVFSGTTCVLPPGVGSAIVKDSFGALVQTPVPAQQTDTAKNGWFVSSRYPGSGASAKLVLHKVVDNLNGTATIATNGVDVTVPPYAIPAPATQSGVAETLDTSDTRNTQAISAKNPARADKVSLWTQHTVKSTTTSVSKVRWYEIDVASAAVVQTGAIAFGSGGFAFNGAISPDRQVNGATRRFGSNMVLTYNTSSSTTFARILAVSKLGAGAVSAPVLIKASPGPMRDFFCPSQSPVCRWGDYAAATPDPLVSAAATRGKVWITNQYDSGGTSTFQSNWRTWNAGIVP